MNDVVKVVSNLKILKNNIVRLKIQDETIVQDILVVVYFVGSEMKVNNLVNLTSETETEIRVNLENKKMIFKGNQDLLVDDKNNLNTETKII